MEHFHVENEMASKLTASPAFQISDSKNDVAYGKENENSVKVVFYDNKGIMAETQKE